MDKYLQQILKEVNTIIIPGLGALTITSAKTGDIYFMPFLKHDDNKLSTYISENEGINHHDAKNIIAKYVREILAKLDQGETYDMFQFGRFIKNSHDEIEFQRWEDYQIVDKSILAASKRAKESKSSTETKIENTEKNSLANQSSNEVKITSSSNGESTKVTEEKLNFDQESTSEINNSEQNITDKVGKINQHPTENNSEINEESENEVPSIIDDSIGLDLPTIEQKSTKPSNLDDILSKYEEESNVSEEENLQIDSNVNETLNESVIPTAIEPEKNELDSHSIVEKESNVEESVHLENKKNSDTHEIINESNSSIEKPKKKRNDLILWLIVGVILASGILGYTLYQRKSEKIIIKERILAKSSHSIDKKDPIKKIVTTKIVSKEKSEVIKKEVITPKTTPIKKITPTTPIASPTKTTPQAKLANSPKKVETKPIIETNSPKKFPTTPDVKIADNTKSNTSNSTTNNKNTSVQPKNSPSTKIATVPAIKPAVNATKINPTNTSSVKPLPTTKTQTTQTNNESSKIQLIAGSFKDKANADKLVVTLKSQGYKNAHVTEFNGNFQVAIDAYSTLSETMKALKAYKKDAWVKAK